MIQKDGNPWKSLSCGVQMVLKCADIGHLAAGIHTHKRWAFQLEEEFFRQVCVHATNQACSLLQVLLHV